MACFMAMFIFQNIYAIDVVMAGILHNVFSKGMYTLKDPENVSKFKTLVNHSGLYFGLIVYTTIGAKVMRFNLTCTYVVPPKSLESLGFSNARASC